MTYPGSDQPTAVPGPPAGESTFGGLPPQPSVYPPFAGSQAPGTAGPGVPSAPQPPTYDPTAIGLQYSAPPAGYGMPVASAMPTMVVPPKRPLGMIIVSSLG